MNPHITIGKRKIGKGYPTYVIAEMSANHQNDFEIAKKIVYAARESGADAIKLQTFTADLHTLESSKKYFQVGGGTLWDGATLHSLYKKCEMPWEWQPKLKDLADDIGIDLFSAAVDPVSVAFLEDMGIPVHKISSFEIVDTNLIRLMAKTGKPLIISTGMATLCEIEEAVNAARSSGGEQIALMKCTSAYPAPMEDMNLLTIPHMSQCFSVPVGISDHSMGSTVPVAAVAMGATLVEKHFTLSRKNIGPDSTFSTEPAEFSAMVKAVRDAEKSLGNVRYEITEGEKASRIFRRSLFVVKNIRKGELFTTENIRSIRPGHGLKPGHMDYIIGRKAAQDIEPGTPLNWDIIRSSDDD
jgi:pseudaminic acid synthase